MLEPTYVTGDAIAVAKCAVLRALICIRRPDAYQQKVLAISCVRKATGAGLTEAKCWIEKHIRLPIEFNV
jgi:ribosomal protein L7/L12